MPRVDAVGTNDERPHCGRCLRPVDGITMRGHGDGQWTLTAHCHGERESVDVSSADLRAIAATNGQGKRVRFGVAFEHWRTSSHYRAPVGGVEFVEFVVDMGGPR